VTPRKKVAVVPGDGIGKEVIAEALKVVRASGAPVDCTEFDWSADRYLRDGTTIPADGFQMLARDFAAILVGALGDPRVPGNEHARDILLGLRFRLDLYINFRPTHLFHPKLSPLRIDRRSDGGSTAIDFVIFRENTEGQYTGRGHSEFLGTPDETHVSEELNTRKGVARIIEAAFAWAAANGKTRVTMSDKSNAIPFQRLWGRLFQEIGERFPAIQREHRYVDALALELVREPERFQVIVTTNLYGDILSDLGAGLIGGMGIAASANLHPGRAGLFEPVHGSAPPLVGKQAANPMATVLSGALMLEQLGCVSGAARLTRAVERVVASGPLTPDLGGRGTTGEVARALMAAVA
jgi:3-isopropylmalate dehydrogenase